MNVNTLQALADQLPSATIDTARATCTLKEGTLRVKRASRFVNCIQIWRAQPIVVHLPGKRPTWFVVPISWQIRQALKMKPHVPQKHSFDSMSFDKRILVGLEVRPENLFEACRSALVEASLFAPKIQKIAISRNENLNASLRSTLHIPGRPPVFAQNVERWTEKGFIRDDGKPGLAFSGKIEGVPMVWSQDCGCPNPDDCDCPMWDAHIRTFERFGKTALYPFGQPSLRPITSPVKIYVRTLRKLLSQRVITLANVLSHLGKSDVGWLDSKHGEVWLVPDLAWIALKSIGSYTQARVQRRLIRQGVAKREESDDGKKRTTCRRTAGHKTVRVLVFKAELFRQSSQTRA